MTGDGVTDDFQRLIDALEPYLPDVVVAGGWAHRLFLRHPLAQPIAFSPLTTDDADVAVPLGLGPRDASLVTRLEKAGFKAEMSGSDQPPVTLYRLGEGEFYVEFLATKTGDGLRKSGERDATARVQGIVAQKLPHVDILLVDPWTVSVPARAGAPVVELRVPNAPAYLAQKVLVLPDREKDKQDNDVLYIHDTLTMFAGSLPQLRAIWESIKGRLTRKQVRNVSKMLTTIFGAVDDRIRRAAIIAQGTGRASPPDANQIQARCLAGLRAIFDAA
jgi:hypothetical protein